MYTFIQSNLIKEQLGKLKVEYERPTIKSQVDN